MNTHSFSKASPPTPVILKTNAAALMLFAAAKALHCLNVLVSMSHATTVLFSLLASPMTSEAALKLLCLSLFLACFGSFIWGMTSFFRLAGQISTGVRVVQSVGSIMAFLHLILLLRVHSTAALQAVVAVSFYTAALALFWWSTWIHRRNPPRMCYNAEVPDRLVVSGPYRWIRHPFYTAYMLAWLAGAFAAHEPWLLLSLLCMSVLYVRAAMLEEHKLESSSLAFEFEQYRKTTGMFLPKW